MLDALLWFVVIFFTVRLIIILRRRKKAQKVEAEPPAEPWYHEPWIEAQKWIETAEPPESGKYATWHEALNRPITDELRFAIEYADVDGVVTERTIQPEMIHIAGDRLYIAAFCEERQETRTFLDSNIRTVKNLQTGRNLAGLGAHLQKKY